MEFLDTNVLVYAFDRTAGVKHERAATLLSDLWLARRGCISIQVLQEFYVICVRKIPAVKPEYLRTAVRDLSRWRVFAPTAEDVLEAIDLHRRYQISWWDALIVHSASRSGCAVLWSEDLNAGQRFGSVQVQNSFAQ